MKKVDEIKFNFWCPIEKAQEIDPQTGQTIMKLGGIASTSDEDTDGEFLDPQGFDIAPLLQSGLVNWHHQAKGQPATIIGEPTKAEIRPEGLYIETELYPSSTIARDVWELAETLEKDSKTRRLGYSIEGKVVKRKSNDKKHPDYKKIEKAVITGVAITHQPKNAQTFANIIKGNIDELDYNEPEEEEEKAVDTENGKALIKESVDGQTKKQVFNKSQTLDKLFSDLPGISISKAEKIYTLIKNIADMKKKKTITDEDISKAYEALGLAEEVSQGENLQKGCDTNGGDTSSPKDVAKADDSEDEDDEEEDGVDGTVGKGKDDKVKKGGDNRFDRLEKAIATSYSKQTEFIKALAVMVKGVSQKAETIIAENEGLKEIVKAQDETISIMSEKIESYGSQVPAAKSISANAVVDRAFAKAQDAEELGGRKEPVQGVSMSKQPQVVAEILDKACFQKGFDDEFSKAITGFEATHLLPVNVIARLKNEYNVTIVK